MRPKFHKILITPLDWSPDLDGFLPFHLGFGFQVRDVSADVASLDLQVWKRLMSDEERERIKGWSVCLVNNYRDLVRGDRERLVETLMHWVVAHLRLIVPNRINADNFLRAEVTANSLSPLTVSGRTGFVYLENCEQICAELKLEHLQKLSSWMRWIIGFWRKRKSFYPLSLSLQLAEMARREDDARIRHMLRVMALEALVSTGKTYGFKALGEKLPKLLGPQTDVYAQYRNINQLSLPPLILSKVLPDICALRNKVAHGDVIPEEWLARNRRYTIAVGEQLTYCEELLEGSTGLLSLTWQTIVDSGLQNHFGTKDNMEAYFNSLSPHAVEPEGPTP